MQADHLCRVCVEKNALALLEMFSPNAWNGITYLFHHLLLGHLILYNCNIRHFTFNTAHYTYYHFCRNRLYESRIYTSNGQKRRNAQTFLLSRGGDNILWSNGGLDGCQGGDDDSFLFLWGSRSKKDMRGYAGGHQNCPSINLSTVQEDPQVTWVLIDDNWKKISF